MDNHWSASIPRSVKVGYRVCPIMIVDASEVTPNLGEYQQWRKEIRICRDLAPDIAANILLHEVMHACYDIHNIKQGDDEERLVDTVASAISGIYVDSPEVMEWIGQRLVGAKQ